MLFLMFLMIAVGWQNLMVEAQSRLCIAPYKCAVTFHAYDVHAQILMSLCKFMMMVLFQELVKTTHLSAIPLIKMSLYFTNGRKMVQYYLEGHLSFSVP